MEGFTFIIDFGRVKDKFSNFIVGIVHGLS